jgi:hypothetical protein
MDRIRELVGRITTLTAEELAELRTLLVSEADTLDTDEATVDDIAVLQELAGFGELLMGQEAERAAAQEQAQADRQAARERIAALNPPADPEADPEPDPTAEPAAADPEAAPAASEPVPEPVAASGQVARMAARQGTPTPSPEAAGTGAPARNGAVLLASGLLRGRLDPTAPLTDRMELAEAMAETLDGMPRHGPPRGDVLLASASWQYPEARDLRRGGSAQANSNLVEAVTGMQALTATGGICAPTNVDYTVPTWATADRPLRDALPSFQATRGGILFVQPPDIAGLAGATGLWTEATDASPGSATKPIIQVTCGSTTQVFVEAVSTRLGFGNMEARFAPEQVAANTDLAAAAAARIAENNLLNLIAAQCVAGVTTATMLGAARDLLTALHQAVYAYRNAHRIPDSQTMTAIFPAWLRGLIKIDLLRELAHDNSGAWNVLMISDAQVDELFTSAGVNPVWHLDGQPSGVTGGVAQTFGIQAGSGVIEVFPTKLVWYLYPEGFFQFLDAGRLDLGVVRDSTLDATNDYETFSETFEGIAYRGFASGALQLVSTLCASGASSATIGSVTCA